MPTLNELRGLRASDRTEEEKRNINQIMGYQEEPQSIDMAPQRDTVQNSEVSTFESFPGETPTSALIKTILKDYDNKEDIYNQALAENQQYYQADKEDLISTKAVEDFNKKAFDISSYYRKYAETDKLPLDYNDKKQLISEYRAREEAYGTDNADLWLNDELQRRVAKNQSRLEQMFNGFISIGPTIEAGAIQAVGNVYGALDYILGGPNENQSTDLSKWDQFIDAMQDNEITRYGRDLNHAKASNVLQGLENLLGISDETAQERINAMKSSATKYNPEGIGDFAVLTTPEEDKKAVSWSTPAKALESSGFTALTMLVGAGEAALAKKAFGLTSKGIMAAHNSGKAFKTYKGLKKALEVNRKALNLTDAFVIPMTAGTMEGLQNGLESKIKVQYPSSKELNDFYKQKIDTEVEEILNDPELNQMVAVPGSEGTQYVSTLDPNKVYQAVVEKYRPEYEEAKRQIDWAASKAGIHDFYINSLINGAINQTLKAGLMAPRVQETLRNARLTGWAYRKPKFTVDADGVATPKISKAGQVVQVLKEPFGEAVEEYSQNLSSDTFTGAAENNINEFIDNKFNGDGTAHVTDTFSSDYAAAWTALKQSLVSKESIESAVLGALSSAMGTVSGVNRGYHRDENGKIVRNSVFDPRNFTKGYKNERGEEETWEDYLRRVIPWRSSVVNAIYDIKDENAEARETAAILTDWLRDPNNRAKWDGLQGTQAWISEMEKASRTNDEFSYRKAQMGKAINDIMMLRRLEGTEQYESIIAELQKAAEGNVSQNDIDGIRQAGGEDYKSMTDKQIVEKIQSNANKMLGLMSTVEREGLNLDRMLGRIDDDTKQSLIYGKIMAEDFQERSDQLSSEIEGFRQSIQSSRPRSTSGISEDLKKLILQDGSLNAALRSQQELQDKKEWLTKRVKELEAIDSDKLSDAQKKELAKSKSELKTTEANLSKYDALYVKDENRNKTDQIDSSIATLVLNEEEIMELDPITRAIVLAKGSAKVYNATHQDRQEVDRLNLDITEKQHDIDALEDKKKKWVTPDGRVKKGHNKQVEKVNKQISQLKKEVNDDMRALDNERKELPHYNANQQQVIDNLLQQGTSLDSQFLDKVVDLGRLQHGIKDYQEQYQSILANPEVFNEYVNRAKQRAALRTAEMRGELIAGIEDFEKYSQELNSVLANASQVEQMAIQQALLKKHREQKELLNDITEKGQPVPLTNYERWQDNQLKKGELLNQVKKNPELTGNDVSLLVDAMEYLASKGVDLTDREAIVNTLIEPSEQGTQGGKFQQWVEDKNERRVPQQRTVAPYFTSIGEIVSQYVQLVNGKIEDDKTQGNRNPEISLQTPETAQSGPSIPPQQTSPAASNATSTASPDPGTASLMHMGAVSNVKADVETPVETAFNTARNLVASTNGYSDETKKTVIEYLNSIKDGDFTDVDDLLLEINTNIKHWKEEADVEDNETNKKALNDAASLLNVVYNKLSVRTATQGEKTQSSENSDSNAGYSNRIVTFNIDYMREVNPNTWAVKFYDEHQIRDWNRDNTVGLKESVYFLTDSRWTDEVFVGMGEDKYESSYHMPIVVAVQISEQEGKKPKATAIEINGIYYQPIGILESGKNNKGVLNPGWESTKKIRANALTQPGTHLITVDGTPEGKPLVTHVNGANYKKGYHKDGTEQRTNSQENNTDFITGVIRDIDNAQERERLEGLSREELVNDEVYQNARERAIEGLVWLDDDLSKKTKTNVHYEPNRMRGNSDKPIYEGVYHKPMAQAKSRTTDKDLETVLREGDSAELLTFNSRIQSLFREVLRPLYQYTSDDYRDESGKIITENDLNENTRIYEDEAARMTKFLKRLSEHYVYMNYKTGWQLLVTCPEGDQYQIAGSDKTNSTTTYRVLLVNDDTNETIVLGDIKRNSDKDNAMENYNSVGQILRNLLWDKENNRVRDFLNWQMNDEDVKNIHNPNAEKADKARQVFRELIDDDLISFAGTELNLRHTGVELKNPFNKEAKPLYTETKTTNKDNAKASSPTNVTPRSSGSIVTNSGRQVDPDSGADVTGAEDTAAQRKRQSESKSDRLKNAEKIVSDLKSKSSLLPLSKDGNSYELLDPVTGEVVERYIRVTSVIKADNSLPELTEDAAAMRRISDYVWTPTLRHIYAKLQERHSLVDLTDSQLKQFTNIDKMSKDLNISVDEINSVVAELRSEHRKEGIGSYGVPSSAVGNSVDSIVRDFFAGEIKEKYPNVTEKDLNSFVEQLRLFKSDLDSRGIHIISNGVVAYGDITVTDNEGTTKTVKVAGTLDLFGYDDAGNFYIFDMKTTREHSEKKLQKEKAKWSRQISMYADLLKQRYTGEDGTPKFEIQPGNMRIIPIDVSYPAPDNVDYTVDNDDQLMVTRGNGAPEKFDGATPTMRATDLNGQFTPGYTKFDINWDRLTSIDQETAAALGNEVKVQDVPMDSPKTATIETPSSASPSFESGLGNAANFSYQKDSKTAPEITPNGEESLVPAWENLNDEQKELLAEFGITNPIDYEDRMSDPTEASQFAEMLNCRE